MTSPSTSAGTVGTLLKPTDVPPRQRWQSEIKAAEKELERFYQRAEAANRRYLDERDVMDAEAKKFNIFYANTNILESALYSQVPKPQVSRRYTDYRDQVGRVAALILERALSQDLNDPDDTFDATMRNSVQDRLVPGLGTAWLRLETETEDIPESEGGSLTNDTMSTAPGAKSPEGGGEEGFTVPAAEADPTFADPNPVGVNVPLKKIKNQRVMVDYVYWRDFIFSPCRVWTERRWVGRKTYLTYDQLKRRFGKEKADLTHMNYTTQATTINRGVIGTTPINNTMQKAVVYEIWDREARKVVWYCEGYGEGLLDTRDDFLQLSSFEPCPGPMFANTTTSSCTPRPDYFMIQDQYIELDTVNARISLLVSACKVAGVYNQSAVGVQDLLKGNENTLVPVPNWSQFSEKGGVEGQIQWLPLDQIQLTLQRLYESREAIKGQIYELTGIADIVRGASKASETLGAQQIKAQFASVRIKKLQDEVSRFASDILRIKAEIMAKHFSVDILIRKSGITVTDNDEFIPSAIALIKSEEGFQWRVCVQADSMAQADYANEKKDRIEFMSAVSGYLGNALPMAQQVPETKPIILSILKWGMASFKQADDIEGMLDKQLSMMENKPPPPPPPDPKMAAVQAKIQGDQQKAQLDGQAKQQDMQIQQQKATMETQAQHQKLDFEMAMQKMEMAMKKFELMMDQKKGEQDIQLQQAKGAQEMHQTQVEGAVAINNQQQEHALAMETQAAQASQAMSQTAESHKQNLQQGKEQGKQKLTLAKQQAAMKPKPAQGK
jgi:hypothetical protein